MTYIVSLGPLARQGVPLVTLIADLANAGFGGVSIDPQLMLEMTDTVRRDVASAVADLELVVALHGSFDTPIEDLGNLADLLGPQLGNITFDPVLGWTSAGLIFSTKRMSPYLQELENLAKQHGFSYGVEDFPETPFALQMYQDDLSPLLESDRFGILIDIGHFNESVHKYGYYKGVNPEEHFAQLPLRLLEVHLSDNNGKEDQHLPLGMGTIDFASVARGLRKIGFDGLSTIEIEPTGKHEDAIARAKEQITGSLAFWRELLEKENMKGPHHKADAGDG
jgi:sugar phosphate isomerase/epimerase